MTTTPASEPAKQPEVVPSGPAPSGAPPAPPAELIALWQQQFNLGPPPNPALAKWNEEHLHKALDNSESNGKRYHEWQMKKLETAKEDRGDDRTQIFRMALLGVVVVFGLCWLFKDQPAVLTPIMSGLGGLIAGGFGGYGLANRRAPKADEP
jgi:hypothetical protein